MMELTKYRKCARCGNHTVVRGIDWPLWEHGMPVGLECITPDEVGEFNEKSI